MTDIHLHYKEQGTGFPLVLLHGNGENCNYFEHQLSFFGEKYRVIAVDTRGHGKSPRGEAPFTIRQFADDLNSFLEEMEIPQAIVLGFSDGANTALCFALKYPEKLKALVLNGGNLNPGGVKASVQIPIELGYRISGLFTDASEKARRNHEMLRLMVKDPALKPEELGKIRVPVLVIAGTKDMIKEEHTRLIAESIPGAELRLVKGDHFIAAKEPGKFNGAVDVFLEELWKNESV